MTKNDSAKLNSEDTEFTVSCGNVFADLGFDQPEIELAKADLAIHLTRIIKERGLTQAAAGKLLGLAQPDVSLIARGRLEDFSIERLMQLLTRIDQDVEIVVRKSANGHGVLIATIAA